MSAILKAGRAVKDATGLLVNVGLLVSTAKGLWGLFKRKPKKEKKPEPKQEDR